MPVPSTLLPSGARGGVNSRVLVVGIDPGTTSFKCATDEAEEVYDNRGTPHLVPLPRRTIDVIENFPGSEQQELKCASTLLIYNEQGTLTKWGHKASNFQSHADFDPELLVNHWKFAVLESTNLTARQLRQDLEDSARRLGKEPISFIEDFFRAVSNFVIGEDGWAFRNGVGSLEDYRFIDVVIAVPPGWARNEHRAFSHAAAVGLGTRPNLRVFTVSETECALRTWMYQGGDRLIKHLDIVVLLDLGGGTTCISVYRFEDSEDRDSKWAHIESHSPSAGSEMVTQEFLADVKRRLNGVDGLKAPLSRILYQAKVLFEVHKKQVGADPEEGPWFVPVPGLRPDPTRPEFRNDKLRISGAQLLRYFQPSQDQLFAKVKEVVTRITSTYEKPRYCLMAGAYASNLLIKKRFDEANFGIKVIHPNSIAELVVRGACHARIDGDFRQVSGSRYSIGVVTYILWKDAIKLHPKPHKRRSLGDDWAPVIYWIMKKGDSVDPDREIRDDRGVPWKRYFEPSEDIKFADSIVVSESLPPQGKYTVLEYNTANPALWKENKRNLRERGIVVEASEVTWDIANTRNRLKDGAPLKRSSLWVDNKDTRKTKRRVLKYTYFLNPTQTDCQIFIETQFQGGLRDKINVGKRELVVLDSQENESVALEDEYASHLQASRGDEGSESHPAFSYGTPQSHPRSEGIRPRMHHRVSDPAQSCDSDYEQSGTPRWQEVNAGSEDESSNRQVFVNMSQPSANRTRQGNKTPKLSSQSVTNNSTLPSVQCLQEIAASSDEIIDNQQIISQHQQGQSTPNPDLGNSAKERQCRTRSNTHNSNSRNPSPLSSVASDIYNFPDSDSNLGEYVPQKKKSRKSNLVLHNDFLDTQTESDVDEYLPQKKKSRPSSLREPVIRREKHSLNELLRPRKRKEKKFVPVEGRSPVERKKSS